MREEFRPAIEALQKDLKDLEQKAAEIKKAINTLCSHADMSPLYPTVEEASAISVGSIRADTFYGKRLSTAAREYLEMRKAADMGPAKPRDVYEALQEGGFVFDTKDEQTALVSLRATLRKNSSIFHRLPNGQYGLSSWYPNAKRPRLTERTETEDTLEIEPDDVPSESDEGGENTTAGADNCQAPAA